MTRSGKDFGIYAEIIARGIAKIVVSFVFIFLLAGRIDYIQGWALLGFGVVITAIFIKAFWGKTGLVIERLHPGPGAKGWDKVMVTVYEIFLSASFLVAILDAGRFGWSAPIPNFVYVLAYLLMVFFAWFTLSAMLANEFFSTVVRIQDDRGHRVVDTGPYAHIRHPGYTGLIFIALVIPIILGSLWGLIPAAGAAISLVVRTVLEDRTLHDELRGYPEYAARVRYKLIPWLW